MLDVDGTLKQAESPYEYLHTRLGVAAQGLENARLAKAGQIDYGEWLRRDYFARHLLGERWLEDYVAKANAGGIERVLV